MKLKNFSLVVEKYQEPLLNFFYRLGIDKDEAEDLVQETFLKIYKLLNTKDYRIKNFKTFLWTVAKNIWIDYKRHKKKETLLKEELSYKNNLQKRDNKDVCLKLDIQEALNRLPEKLKLIVILKIYEGLNYKEISEVLELPVSTVKSRMYLALKKLKKILNIKEKHMPYVGYRM